MRIRHSSLWAVVLFALLFAIPTTFYAQGIQPVTLEFATGPAGAGGTIALVGNTASGIGIPIDLFKVFGAAGAPPQGLSYNVNGLGTHIGASIQTTGLLQFDTVTNTIQIAGSVPSLGVSQSTLLQGSITSFAVSPNGDNISLQVQGQDA